jgi:hypothetical protein
VADGMDQPVDRVLSQVFSGASCQVTGCYKVLIGESSLFMLFHEVS